MNTRRLRTIVAPLILAGTVGAFVYYVIRHPQIIKQLAHLHPLTLVALLGLYALFSIALAIITKYSLAVGRAKIPFKDNILLTCYSSIINFFGPLQSGPGFRIVYLKKRFGISVRDYTFASLLYYGFFALISGVFLCIRALPWWQTALVVVAITSASAYVLWRRRNKQTGHYSLKAMAQLAVATFAQVCLVAIIYFMELHVVDRHVSLAQAITYTGAANFALFVSLTPGAIGIRESFLLFSQHLHHINSSTILAASLIDRAVYILFLGLLFIISLIFHANDRLRLKRTAEPPELRPGQ